MWLVQYYMVLISMMVHAFYNMMKKVESTEDYTLVSLLTKDWRRGIAINC